MKNNNDNHDASNAPSRHKLVTNDANPTPQRRFNIAVHRRHRNTDCLVIRAKSLREAEQKVRKLCPARIDDPRKFKDAVLACGAKPGNWADAVCQSARPTYPAWFEAQLLFTQYFRIEVSVDAKNPDDAKRKIRRMALEELSALATKATVILVTLSVRSVQLAGIEADQERRQGDDSKMF